MKNIVNYIASVITDDPDILNEEALPNTLGMSSMDMSSSMSKPMTSMEISQEANDIAGNDDSSREVEEQLKAKEDEKKAEQLEQQQIIKPQMQKLGQSFNKLDTGIAQGTQSAANSGEQFNNLDSEMTTIRTLLGNLEKTFAR